MTGMRLTWWVIIKCAICSTGVSSSMLTIFLLMIDFTSLPFLATISASETMPMILPFLLLTGAPLTWFLINAFANCLMVMLGITVITSLVMISLASIGFLLESPIS